MSHAFHRYLKSNLVSQDQISATRIGISLPPTFGTAAPFSATSALFSLLLASHLGFWAPIGDSLAVFRLHLETMATLGAAVLFSFRKQRAGTTLTVAVLVSCLSAAGSTYTGLQPSPSAHHSLYQKNLLLSGKTPEAIADDILATSADLVALQELSPRNHAALTWLFEAYQNDEICPGRKNRGVAILSDWEIVEGSVQCFPDLDLVLAQVVSDDGKIWFGSVHLRWPYPRGQHSQAKKIEKVLVGLKGRVIIAGDFNMVPQGSSVRRIERAIGAKVSGRIQTTFPHFGPLVPLPIDHVLLPVGTRASVETRPLLGSDHFGLLARFSL